jgi:DNA-binding sugar fermentation-stimulating protein
MELYTFSKELIKAKVISRPSKIVKSPYLADILIGEKQYLCHTAGLGCSGHIVKDATIWVLEKSNSSSKSTHVVYLIEEDGVLIGCDPMIANKIAYHLLKNNLIISNVTNILPEFEMNNCRFDFLCKSDERMCVVEVKSVPMGENGIGIFPYRLTNGKQKVHDEPISERALKHVLELTNLVTTTKCVLLFIIQRTDVSKFSISKNDIQYYNACKKAVESGVIFKAVSVKWDTKSCYFNKMLEIVW